MPQAKRQEVPQWVEVVTALAGHPMTLRELAHFLCAPRASITNCCYHLVDEGILAKDEEGELSLTKDGEAKVRAVKQGYARVLEQLEAS